MATFKVIIERQRATRVNCGDIKNLEIVIGGCESEHGEGHLVRVGRVNRDNGPQN